MHLGGRQWPDPYREAGERGEVVEYFPTGPYMYPELKVWSAWEGGLSDVFTRLAREEGMAYLQSFVAREVNSISYSQHSDCRGGITAKFLTGLVFTDHFITILVGREEDRKKITR